MQKDPLGPFAPSGLLAFGPLALGHWPLAFGRSAQLGFSQGAPCSESLGLFQEIRRDPREINRWWVPSPKEGALGRAARAATGVGTPATSGNSS